MNKSITITITPCLRGWEWGYVGRWKNYQFWGRNRADVIKQFLNRFWMGN